MGGVGFPGVTVTVIAGNLTANGMYAMMAKYAAGAKSVPHTHPDQRVVTVEVVAEAGRVRKQLRQLLMEFGVPRD